MISDLEINDSVYLHGNIILCDNGLRREVRDLFLQAHHFGNPFNKRHLEMKSDIPGRFIGAETLDNKGFCLLYHAYVPHDYDNEYRKYDKYCIHVLFPPN